MKLSAFEVRATLSINKQQKKEVSASLHKQHNSLPVLTVFIWLQLSTRELEEIGLPILLSTAQHKTEHDGTASYSKAYSAQHPQQCDTKDCIIPAVIQA